MKLDEQYVEMCKKAVEIQRLWTEDTREYGDYFAEIQSNGYVTTDVFCSCPEENNLKYVKNPVWLPRQDQLQDIVISKKSQYVNGFPSITFVIMFGQFANENRAIFNSMEQLWLAFIMSEKYGKAWNSDKKEWI